METLSHFSLLTSLLLMGVGIILCLRLVRVMFRHFNAPAKRLEGHDDLLVDVLRTKVEKARKAENRLSQSRQAYASLAHLYQVVTEHLPLGLVVLDAVSEIQFANPKAREILGLSIPPEEAQLLPEPLFKSVQRMKQDRGVTGHRVELLMGQRWWTLELDLIPLPSMADLLTIQDKTQVSRLEQTLQANRELTLMGEMAAGVAHEVKNVLAVVEGRAQLMGLTGEIETHRDIILKETGRLLAMVKRFMESSKREELDAEWFNVRQWFEALNEVWVSRRENDRVSLEYACRDDLRYFGDPAMLGILVENLVINGLEACAGVACKDPAVRVKLEKVGHQLVLTVSDQGPGFSDDVLKKVFLPFVTSKEDGHGLGLFHSRKIVLTHRGVMEINMNPTQVRCVFPISEEVSTADRSPQPASDGMFGNSADGDAKDGEDEPGMRSTRQGVNP